MLKAAAIIRLATTSLINGTDRFFAEILYRLRRKIDYACPSMGVSLENGGTLIYNPLFVLANEKHMAAILVHECVHLLSDHLPRATVHNLPHSFVNVCADLATNSTIPTFPHKLNFVLNGAIVEQDTVTVENYKTQYTDLEKGRSFEYYVAYFKEAGKVPEGGESDDHSGWGDVSPEAARAIAQRLIEDAVKGAKQAGQELPNSVRELVEELLDSQVPWESVLRRFPDTAEVYSKESSRAYRNRRYGITFPGNRPIRRCTVYVGFDVSGSMGEELITKCNNCLREMSEMGADLKVIFFDDKIYPVVDYHPGVFDEGKIPGGGGTLFSPLFDRVTELGGDGLVVLTDGLLGDHVEEPNYPVVFGILDGYKSPYTWGISVTIK